MSNQEQGQQVSEARIQELRELIGQEAFIIAYTLEGDGTIEVGKVIDAVITHEGQPVPVIIEGRPWRQHHLNMDLFLDLNEAVNAVNQARTNEVARLRARADALVAMQFKAPAEKVQEAEAKQAEAKQAEAEKLAQQQAAEEAVRSMVKKPAPALAKKPAAKKAVTRK